MTSLLDFRPVQEFLHCNLLIPRSPMKDIQATQEKPSVLKEHGALQNMKFMFLS